MELNYDFMVQTFPAILKGIPVTLEITLVSLLVAAPVSFFMALIRIYQVNILRQLVRVYVSFVRGTPMVLQILVIYSLMPSLLNYLIKSLGWDFNVFEIDPIWYAYVVFTLNTIALLSEVFRSALLSVNEGQIEAGLSVGMTLPQIYRRIIIPQAMVAALPNLCNLAVNLIKNTSLAFLMTVKDITATGKIAASYGYNYIEAYVDVFVVYLILCTLVQLLFSFAEKHVGAFRQLKYN
ncbi:amino acid ABC transporter permease [Propionispora hippei]|uniref:L-cystine transport system permease protein n=1 Tax=Propionispora hippei DSM 15287 TaxID=1123003 RepID=A0A1M6I9Y3_9FIRM|nr:amino acid ABC transporter permease [Propionispora hippei]SHJ31215.1 L-cystine transport system permease protein [Propionispora hippei DSM 15287]